MNNAISILIDSVMWEATGTKRTGVSTTPFIDSLKKESVTASNMYSQGPYTDAATKGLYTGRNTLDDFGYYYKLNSSPTNHYKVFKDNGYETYAFYYPYYMIGSEIKNTIDHSIYTSGFIFSSEWGGIFSYYAELIKGRRLNDNEYILLKKRFALLFDVWIGFYEDLISISESKLLIEEEIENFDIENALNKLKNEESKFKDNPYHYIDDFLLQGKHHLLVTIDKINVDHLIDRSVLTRVYKKYKHFFKQSNFNNIKANIWQNRPGIRRIITAICNAIINGDKDGLKFIKNYYRCLTSVQTVNNDSYRPLWQLLPSARREFNAAIDILKQRKSDRPFYLSMHILDPHSYLSYFSYDMLNNNTIGEEFQVLSNFVNELGTDFRGSLPYYLSIRYVDFCLEKFCHELKNLGLWENTSLLLFADHGSSCSFYPLHNTTVNCFDDECYHIPVLIRQPGYKGINIKSYHNSKDIFPTFYDILGLNTPIELKGKSMISSESSEQSYVMTEYMGPGCPDMLSRPMWLSCRDKHYIVAYKVCVSQNFCDGELSEVYDLQNDPLAYKNIAKSVNIMDIKYLLDKIENRYNEVKTDTMEFIEKCKFTDESTTRNI